MGPFGTARQGGAANKQAVDSRVGCPSPMTGARPSLRSTRFTCKAGDARAAVVTFRKSAVNQQGRAAGPSRGEVVDGSRNWAACHQALGAGLLKCFVNPNAILRKSNGSYRGEPRQKSAGSPTKQFFTGYTHPSIFVLIERTVLDNCYYTSHHGALRDNPTKQVRTEGVQPPSA